MNEAKDGYLTTEFWLAILSLALTAAVNLGVLTIPQGEIPDLAAKIVTGSMGLITIATYIWRRLDFKKHVATAPPADPPLRSIPFNDQARALAQVQRTLDQLAAQIPRPPGPKPAG